MGHSHGRRWSEAAVQTELLQAAASFGRMPSANELRSIGRNDLACAIPRFGGFRVWSARLQLANKGTETHRGQGVEDIITAFIQQDLGLPAIRQSTRASFDIDVAGIRVDVKSARFGEYGKTEVVRGFIFNISKRKPTCDLYILCGLSQDDQVLWKYFVPSQEARVATLTITEHGKYSRFKNATEELFKLVAERRNGQPRQ